MYRNEFNGIPKMENTKERVAYFITTHIKSVFRYRESHNGRGPFVGNYSVHIKDFEDIALTTINPSGQDVLVIDEVGKMELKSKKFEIAVQNCVMKTNLLVTVPYGLHHSLQLVDRLKTHPNAQIIVVTKENRNSLQAEIIKLVLALVKN